MWASLFQLWRFFVCLLPLFYLDNWRAEFSIHLQDLISFPLNKCQINISSCPKVKMTNALSPSAPITCPLSSAVRIPGTPRWDLGQQFLGIFSDFWAKSHFFIFFLWASQKQGERKTSHRHMLGWHLSEGVGLRNVRQNKQRYKRNIET